VDEIAARANSAFKLLMIGNDGLRVLMGNGEPPLFNFSLASSCPACAFIDSASESASCSKTCTACHYRKLRPDARTPFDKLMLAEAGVLTDSLHITGLAGIEHETRLDGSSPAKGPPHG